MTRRYFHSSIQELEILSENRRDDVSVLQAIQDELTHRKTERAAKLRRHLTMRLTQLGTSTAHNPDSTGTTRQTRVKSESQPPSILPITNEPECILSAWTALEVLSPQTFRRPEELVAGDRTRVAKFSGSQLPWERGERSRPNQRLYYQVILGSIRMEPAVELLIEHYGDTRIEKPSAGGKAALAIVIVDQQGCLVDSQAVAVSSFGWGVMTAIEGELDDLAQWSGVESQLTGTVENLLRNHGTDNRQPLTWSGLLKAYETLVATLELPIDWLEPPEFAIRSYSYYKDRNPPEPILLNSFFLPDLALAKELFLHRNAPRNLRRYLGLERPAKTRDLIRDKEALEDAVSPQKTPLARWPGPGRHPLVLLQQAAVNIAFSETTASGLIGINGPPGTGKTTLLRDLVAGIVTERAQEMATYADPETAFHTTGLKLKAGQGWIHLYTLDESLRGFEIVVASSNNKAVENISSELPGIHAIAEDASQLRYFKTLSDSLQRETWGLIAAVLGNAQNRNRFKQVFWWDDDKGLNSYLRAVAGSSPMCDSGETPTIILTEAPPTTHTEALQRWQIARERFRKALEQSRKSQQRLELLRQEVLSIPRLAKAAETAEREYLNSSRRLKDLRQQHQYEIHPLKSADEELLIHNQQSRVSGLDCLELVRPEPGMKYSRLYCNSNKKSRLCNRHARSMRKPSDA